MDEVAVMLETIHHGMLDSKTFIDLLLEHQLLESFTLDLTFSNGQKQQLAGFYTIHEDNLAALSPELLAQLHQKGYLQAIYMAIASQANIRHLLQLKNKQFE
nr:SapC family protein [Rheinheimera sp. KL1]